MECKNCQTPLENHHRYCPVCGGKIIHNRLSFGVLWADFKDRFLNIDNTFLQTFTDLFKKPEHVIKGYISGIRRRYLDPISYFGIALTLSGVLVFLIRNVFTGEIDMDVFGAGLNQKVFQEFYENALDYQALVFVLLIPMFAFCGWLTLNRHRYIYSEHIVTFTYILAHFTIASFPFSVGALAVSPTFYTSYGIINLLLMILYALYVYRRITNYPIGTFIFRAGVFVVLFLVLYILISNLIFLIFILSGVFSIQDIVGR